MARVSRLGGGGSKGMDLVGKKFGRLTVVEEVEPLRRRDADGRVVRTTRKWSCSCACGTTNHIVQQGNLNSGNSLSCGCVRETHGYLKGCRTKKGRQASRRIHPAWALWNGAKARQAKRASKEPFDLTPEHIDQLLQATKVCPVLGLPLEIHAERYWDASPSLDRLDSSKGYTKDNVWVISARANRIKSDATLAELRLLVAALETRLA